MPKGKSLRTRVKALIKRYENINALSIRYYPEINEGLHTITIDEFLELCTIANYKCVRCNRKISREPVHRGCIYGLGHKIIDTKMILCKENCVICCSRCALARTSYERWIATIPANHADRNCLGCDLSD